MRENPAVDVEDFKAKLLASRAALLEQGAESEPASMDLEQTHVGRLSRIEALQSHAMSQEAERRRRFKLQRIAAALRRIEEGEYGYCESCDARIPARRLEVDPTASQCVECASRAERA